MAALAATLPTFASLAAAGAGAPRRNGGPLGKTERCLFVVLAAAFPIVMPFLAVSLVIGSLITAALRLRTAHRELKAQQLRTHAVALTTTPVPTPVSAARSPRPPDMAIVDHYLWFVHLDRRMPFNIDLGPLHIHLYSRAVFFMWVTAAILALAGIAVLDLAQAGAGTEVAHLGPDRPRRRLSHVDRRRHHRWLGRRAGHRRGDRVRTTDATGESRHLRARWRWP